MSLRKCLPFAPIHQLSLFSRRPTFAPKTPPRNIVSSNDSDSDHFVALGEREGEVQRFLRNHILLRKMNWAPDHFIFPIYIYTAHQFPFSWTIREKSLAAEPEEVSAKQALLTVSDAETGT